MGAAPARKCSGNGDERAKRTSIARNPSRQLARADISGRFSSSGLGRGEPCIKSFFTESLILAQDERWRRA
jgi:hypothetical protein